MLQSEGKIMTDKTAAGTTAIRSTVIYASEALCNRLQALGVGYGCYSRSDLKRYGVKVKEDVYAGETALEYWALKTEPADDFFRTMRSTLAWKAVAQFSNI